MFNIGDTVKINHDGSVGAVVGVNSFGNTTQYTVIVNGRKMIFFEEQLSSFDMPRENLVYTAKELNALLTARLILNPSISSLYSLNSAKIDYIPYQFRPVLKIVKSDSPRILIADGVGVGKTIEAGLVLKELEARFDIKSVLVICPRPLITEKKWQNELKRFGEKFSHIDGKQLRYCIDETDLDYGEWPSDYQKCIIPYSLFDEAIVCGTVTKDGVTKKLDKKSLRVGELASVTMEGDWVRAISLKGRKGLKDKIRRIPVSPNLKRFLPFIRTDEIVKLSSDAIARHVKDYFDGHRTHDLRHTFITRAQEVAIRREIVSLWVGHAPDSSITSLIYTHLEFNEQLQLDEIAKFDYVP